MEVIACRRGGAPDEGVDLQHCLHRFVPSLQWAGARGLIAGTINHLIHFYGHTNDTKGMKGFWAKPNVKRAAFKAKKTFPCFSRRQISLQCTHFRIRET